MDLSDDDCDSFSGPTLSEALLFLTLPASAAPLSSALMPRRHRERILEITKTVTVTEVVNNSPRCHPGTCEVTVTNVDSGSGHPVSVNISHLHEKISEDQSSGATSPVVSVREHVKEETSSGTIERITSSTERILKVETDGDVTFGQRGDNIIDINFTHPITQKEYDELREPGKTLYYHAYEKETTDVAKDLLSPDSAVSDSPKRYMRSDDSDSDTGSLVIHSPVGRADSGLSSNRGLNGKNLSISVGSSEEDDLRYEGPSRSPQPTGQRLPVYVVTAKAETANSERAPSLTTLFADIEAKPTTSTVPSSGITTVVTTIGGDESNQKKTTSMTSLEREEERKQILVVTNVASTMAEEIVETAEDEAAHIAGSSEDVTESESGKQDRPRLTMEVLFTPPTPKENGAPPKPPRRAKYGPMEIVEHVQQYEYSLDDLAEFPIMTSSPRKVLEEHGWKGEEISQSSNSSSETPILTPSRKSSRPPALEGIPTAGTPETPIQPVASPRRSPSSPIVVVDQERKSSMDLLVPPKQPRRKSTVTDIDWFAAFNMKEPTAPKSPRSPLPIDALREAENIVIKRKKSPQPVVPLSPSKIDLDDVFACTGQKKTGDEKCTCNACALMKMSDEDLKKRIASQKATSAPNTSLETSTDHKITTSTAYEDSNISLEDVFSAPTTKQVPPFEEKKEEKAIAVEKEREDKEKTNIALSTLEKEEKTEGSTQESVSPACSSASTNAQNLSSISQFISSDTVLPSSESNVNNEDEPVTLATATDTDWLEQLLQEPPNEEELKETVQHLHDVVVATNEEEIKEEMDFEALQNSNKSTEPAQFNAVKSTATPPPSEASLDKEDFEFIEHEHEKNLSNISQDIGYASQDVSKSEEEFEREGLLQNVSDVNLDDVFVTAKEEPSSHVPLPDNNDEHVIPSKAYEPIVAVKPRDLDEEAKSPLKLKTFDFHSVEIDEFNNQGKEEVTEKKTASSEVAWIEEIVSSGAKSPLSKPEEQKEKTISNERASETLDKEALLLKNEQKLQNDKELPFTKVEKMKSSETELNESVKHERITKDQHEQSATNDHDDVCTPDSKSSQHQKEIQSESEETVKDVTQEKQEMGEGEVLPSKQDSEGVIKSQEVIVPSDDTVVDESSEKEQEQSTKFEDIKASINLDDIFPCKVQSDKVEEDHHTDSSLTVKDIKENTEITDRSINIENTEEAGKKDLIQPDSEKSSPGKYTPIDLDAVFSATTSKTKRESHQVEQKITDVKSDKQDSAVSAEIPISVVPVENSYQLQQSNEKKNAKNEKQEEKVDKNDENSATTTITETTTHYSLDWIEEMIRQIRTKPNSDKEKEETDDSSIEVPPVDDILKLVFDSPCASFNQGKNCGCSACVLVKLSPEELERFWRRVQERHTKSVIPFSLGTGSDTIIKNDDKSEALKPTEEISLDKIFGDEKVHDIRSATVVEPFPEQHTPITPSLSASTVPAEQSSTSHTGLDLSQDQSETTADSWILSVIRDEEAAGVVDSFGDSFELSYLASIREEERQNREASTSYHNYYRDGGEAEIRRVPSARRHVDDYYDEPEEDEMSSEDIDVEGLVDDILSSSLNEAALVAATRSFKKEESRHTDTSVDKKSGDSLPAMYLATAASDSMMESILPLSTPTSSQATQKSFEFGDEKYVSEASMVLSENVQDDYIIRLVFANSDKTQGQNVESAVVTESEIASPSSDETREIVSQSTETTRTLRQVASSDSTISKCDEEILEVEVSQEYFVVKGSYSVVINKTDPLGILLSEIHADTIDLDFALTPKLRRLLLQCLREKAKPHNAGKNLSSRARTLVNRNDPAYDVFYQMTRNRYSAENPTGNINFCTAENNICKDLIEERFRDRPEVFQPNYDHVTHYGPPGGYPEVKQVLCKYLKEHYNGNVEECRLALLPSGNATYDLVCHCLFDSDDVILTNSPTYSRNFVNVSERAECRLESVPFDLSSPRLSVFDFEKSLSLCTEKGDNVRAVILINPHNPLGVIFPVEDIKKLAEWTAEKNLWLIVDESFAQCVHDPNATFESFVSYQLSLLTKSVWFWSLSKDFGLPGVKISIAQTNDRDLHQALCQIELTEPVSALAQDFIVNFLSDRVWLDKFNAEKKKRLRLHYEFVTEELKSLNIPFQSATAGIFVFVDFRQKLSSQSAAGEDEFWRSLTSVGIFMTPGAHTKCPQPGWMRLVFACDKEQVKEGFRRLHKFFNSGRDVRELSY